MDIILSYISIWVPSLVAVISTIGSVLTTTKGAKNALEELKKDDQIKRLEQRIKSLEDVESSLLRSNKLLLDKITRINGYMDHLEDKHDKKI